jgi:hypothetical protein
LRAKKSWSSTLPAIAAASRSVSVPSFSPIWERIAALRFQRSGSRLQHRLAALVREALVQLAQVARRHPIDVIPPRARDDELVVERQRRRCAVLGIGALTRQLECRVALLAVARAAPEGQHGVPPRVEGREPPARERPSRRLAQRAELHAEVRELGLHVRLHPRRLLRVGAAAQLAPDGADQGAV